MERESPAQPGEPPQVADLLEQVVTSGGRLVGAADVLVYLVEHDAHGSQRLIVRHGAGCFATSVGRSVGKGEGLAGEVWRIGAPLAVEDYQRAGLGGCGGSRRGRDSGALAVPLHSHGAVVGVLGVASGRPGRVFSQAEIALLCRFGEVAGAAIDNAVRLAAARRELAELAQSEARYRTVFEEPPRAGLHRGLRHRRLLAARKPGVRPRWLHARGVGTAGVLEDDPASRRP